MSVESIVSAEETVRTGTPAEISTLYRNALPSVVGNVLGKLPDSDRIKVLSRQSRNQTGNTMASPPLAR